MFAARAEFLFFLLSPHFFLIFLFFLFRPILWLFWCRFGKKVVFSAFNRFGIFVVVFGVLRFVR